MRVNIDGTDRQVCDWLDWLEGDDLCKGAGVYRWMIRYGFCDGSVKLEMDTGEIRKRERERK